MASKRLTNKIIKKLFVLLLAGFLLIGLGGISYIFAGNMATRIASVD
jgi:hypothetical protein